MSIEQMIDEVLSKEGGFVNHPADKGGATKYGITQRRAPSSTWRSLPLFSAYVPL